MRQLNAKTKFKQHVSPTGSKIVARGNGRRYMHPYLRLEFWLNPINQFWNTDMYSQESKDYFNNCISAQQNKNHN